MVDEIVKKLKGVKWSLVAMAAFCFGYAVYMYVTPVWGGLGLFMVTPRDGLDGLVALLPWIGIFLGATTLILSFASTSAWVLGWTEPVLGAGMLALGLWELYFPYNLVAFSQVYAVVGMFLAFYIVFVALEMARRGAGHWGVELALALVILCVSFYNLMGLGGAGAALPVSCLELFLAGWGFVYGALSLSGAAPAKGSCLLGRIGEFLAA